MINNSGLVPAGRAVLVETYTPEMKKSIIVMPDSVSDNAQMLETRAIVVDVGPHAWHDEPSPRAKVGDKVFISKFAGFLAKGTKDGKPYRFINDRDIFARIVEES